jgi:DNA-binding NarL/FixJ family response regulator
MSGSGAATRVLVVHENALGAEALQVALDQEDDLDVVAGATSCEAAVDAAVEMDVGVVVIDYCVENDHGPAAAAAIRDQVPGVAEVMLVDSGSDGVTHAAVRAGCSAVIRKDRPLRDLVDAIGRVARGEVLLGADQLARLIPFKTGRAVGMDLSAREREVLALLSDGMSNKDIAERLSVSGHTVRNHVQRILMKLHAASRLEAVAIAVRHGLISR